MGVRWGGGGGGIMSFMCVLSLCTFVLWAYISEVNGRTVNIFNAHRANWEGATLMATVWILQTACERAQHLHYSSLMEKVPFQWFCGRGWRGIQLHGILRKGDMTDKQHRLRIIPFVSSSTCLGVTVCACKVKKKKHVIYIANFKCISSLRSFLPNLTCAIACSYRPRWL